MYASKCMHLTFVGARFFLDWRTWAATDNTDNAETQNHFIR